MITRDQIRFHNYPFAGVDAMTASTSRHFPRHTHDQYGIGVVDSGAHSSWSARGQVEATPGSLICVNPGEVHDGRPLGEPSRSWRLLYLEPRTVANILEDVCEGVSYDFMFVAPVFADKKVRGLFDTAFAQATACRKTCRDTFEGDRLMFVIRPCRATDFQAMLAIVNSAALGYRGVIPEDCWHEPFMSSEELRHEMGAGVAFSGYEAEASLVGVMGIQPVRDVWLIRHAYLLPEWQRQGVGAALIKHLLLATGERRVLVGTWAAADWAASIAGMASRWWRVISRIACSRATGAFRSARGRPRWCLPIHRRTTRPGYKLPPSSSSTNYPAARTLADFSQVTLLQVHQVQDSPSLPGSSFLGLPSHGNANLVAARNTVTAQIFCA